jgi:hypothetical protein
MTSYFCNKCGYVGEAGPEHNRRGSEKRCNYSAGKVEPAAAEKTPGQIAMEAMQAAYRKTWSERGHVMRENEDWAAAADAVIEHCATAIKQRRWSGPFPGETDRELAAFALGMEEAMKVARSLKSETRNG